MRKLEKLQEKLNYSFKDPTLLKSALTHSSYANENPKTSMPNNERLEFLGDSLLGMTVALLIYNNKNKQTEGQMTTQRAELVCEKSLASIASELDLGSYLFLGKGEENGGGRSRPSILADAFEAVLAAMYIDGGFEPIKEFISGCLETRLNRPVQIYKDYKTRLQEVVQLKQGQSLVYEMVSQQGPDHDKSFTVEVKVNGKTVGKGTGKSKKSAEQEAAKAAINVIN